MTEMVQGEGAGSNFAPAPVTTSPAPSSDSTERTFKQSEVNDLIGRAKSEAIERFKRESSVASHTNPPQQQQYAPPAQQQPTHTPPQQPLPYNGMSEQEYRRIASEEAQRSRSEWEQEQQRQAQEQNAQRIASEFFTKVGAGDGGMKAFETKLQSAGIDLRAIPYHVQLANMVDNTKEVMEDLLDNPMKIGQLQNLIDIDLRAGRQPNLAMAEMKKLSQSIKDNAAGSRYRAPNEPLSQLRPSNAGTDNKGALTTADYKKRYKV